MYDDHDYHDEGCGKHRRDCWCRRNDHEDKEDDCTCTH